MLLEVTQNLFMSFQLPAFTIKALLLETQFTVAWKQSALSDKEARENLYMLCQNLAALKGYIESVVEDGKLANAALKELQNRQQFEKRK